MENILGLDLGTKMGWATYHEDTEYIRSGMESFAVSRFHSADRRFWNFKRWLADTWKENGYKTIYYEEVRRHIGVDAAHCYGGFKAVMTEFCIDNEISFVGVPVGTIKKFITGKGNAGKKDVIRAVKDLGYYPHDDNEADALAIMFYALKQERDQEPKPAAGFKGTFDTNKKALVGTRSVTSK